MTRMPLFLSLIFVLLFPLSCKKIGLILEEEIWVCRNYKGPPQCMRAEDINPPKELQQNGTITPPVKNKTVEKPLIRAAGAGVSPENAEKKFGDGGIKIHETKKIYKPVCEACTICPEYDMDLCFQINENDLPKAQGLGFNRKDVKQIN